MGGYGIGLGIHKEKQINLKQLTASNSKLFDNIVMVGVTFLLQHSLDLILHVVLWQTLIPPLNV